MNRNTLMLMLKDDIVDIEFTKADGSSRAMTCTLREKSLPKNTAVTKRTNNNPDEVCHVFDTHLQDWRAFRFDRLNTVNGLTYKDVDGVDVFSNEFSEKIAILIYERAMRWGRAATTPVWMKNGNAQTQDEARTIAAVIIKEVLAGIE